MASLAVFHTAVSLPSPHRHRTPNPSNPNPTTGLLRLPAACPPLRSRTLRLAASAAASPPAPAGRDHVGAASALERCLAASPATPSGAAPAAAPPRAPPAMKGGKQYGAFGAVTLEKAKLDLSQRLKKVNPELATGGGGGDIGKKIGHGGGDGGDDDGDDDDYFDDFDDGDEGEEGGLFRRRLIIQELFDREFVDAVLQEWYKTMSSLPAGLRQAYEMGLVSSAQMVRYLSMNARPTTSRFIARALPESLSRAFVGRMLADPSFLYKMILESVATLGSSVWWELKNRKERIKQEWDLALVNVLTVTACNAFVVWSLAPCRSYGNTFRFDLQNTIQKLPNNIFEKSYPMREFDLQKRIHAFFYKAAQLCLVGLTAGSVQGGLSKFLSARKEGRLSVTIPSVSTNALGYGAFLGLYANLRYQILCGLDRYMVNRFDVLGVAIFFSMALRLMNIHIGETSRLAWLGVEADPLHSDSLLRAYNRPTEVTADQSESRWFISKNAIVSGLGLLGIKQGEPEAASSKPRRKRVVRKKVSSS